MKAKLIAAAVACLAPLAVAPQASAHHAFTMFALDKLETVDGVVKQFKWTMPHVWIYMTVPSKTGGAPEEWGFECHAPNLIARKGWKSTSLKPGDKVSILMHPMRDGSKAGSVVHVTTAGGQQLWNADSVNAP